MRHLVVGLALLLGLVWVSSADERARKNVSPKLARDFLANYLEAPLMPRVERCYESSAPTSGTNCPPKLEVRSRQSTPDKPQEKILMCSLFHNEAGYLAEWVAYYQLHGIERIVLWDHGSVDAWAADIEPWVRSGFVVLRNASQLLPSTQQAMHKAEKRPLDVMSGTMATDTTDGMPGYAAEATSPEQPAGMGMGMGPARWDEIRARNAMARRCSLDAMDGGYAFYMTAHIDEYILPVFNGAQGAGVEEKAAFEAPSMPYVAIADVISELFAPPPAPQLPRLSLSMDWVHFSSSPHLLEPLDLLIIEAYQVRHSAANARSYYDEAAAEVIAAEEGGRRSAADVLRRQRQVHVYRVNWGEEGGGTKGPAGGPVVPVKGAESVRTFLAECCFEHGCVAPAVPEGSGPCHLLSQKLRGKFDSRPPLPADSTVQGRSRSQYSLRVNHYTRSLERYHLAPGTYETVKGDMLSLTLNEFLPQAHGTTYDPSALVFSCLLRWEVYKVRRAEQVRAAEASSYGQGAAAVAQVMDKWDKHHRSWYFQRNGPDFFRNVEYGRPIESLSRRGRGTGGGAALPPTPTNPTTMRPMYKHAMWVQYYDGLIHGSDKCAS